MMDRLNIILKECGAAAWGTAKIGQTQPIGEVQLPDGAQSVVCAVFPYFTGHGAGGEVGTIAKFARGEDYHRAVLRRLEAACAELRLLYPSVFFKAYTDVSPISEVRLARVCGAAMTGMHGLAISPRYGSYAVIGEIICGETFTAEKQDAGYCGRCGACASACPTGALTENKGMVSYERQLCVSHITQKRGELSTLEQEAVKKAGFIWGCDLCQDACPHNKDAEITPLPEFRKGLVYSLKRSELEGLSGREFKKKYGARSFAYKGAGPIIRNMKILGLW